MLTVTERPRRKRLSWESRCEIVAKVKLQGMSIAEAAACSGVHRASVYRLVARYEVGGWGASPIAARSRCASRGAAHRSSRRGS